MNAQFLSKGNWPNTRLKFLGRFKGGAGFPHEEQGRTEGELPFFKVKSLGYPDSDGVIRATEDYVSHDTAYRLGAFVFPKGSVVFAKVGAALLLNRFFVLGQPSCIDNNMMGFIVDERKASLPFVLRALSRFDFARLVNPGPVPSLNESQVSNEGLLLPSLSEQRRIARYLDEEITKVDRLMTLRLRQMELLREQRSAIIQAAVTRGLNRNASLRDSGTPWIGDMPDAWQLLPLRAVLTERGEYNAPLKTTNFLSVVKDVGVVPYDERQASGNKKSDEMEKYKIIHQGDIVANRMNLIFGSVGLSAHFGCSSTEYYVLRARNASVDTRFYGYIFGSRGFQRSLFGIGRGILAHRMRIYYEDLKKVLLPVPPLHEQQKIVRFIEQERIKFNTLHTYYARQLELLTEYRIALIHECVTGQRALPYTMTSETR